MQHQRAIVMTDETIIDQRERVQLEVNSAMAGKSRLLSREPSAALTKGCCRAQKWVHTRLGQSRAAELPRGHGFSVPEGCPAALPACTCPMELAGVLLCGVPPARRARSRPAARAALLRSTAVLGARIGWALLQWGRSLGVQPCCSPDVPLG